MKLVHKSLSLTLAVLLLVTVYGLIRTGRQVTPPRGSSLVAETVSDQATQVDQTPLLTAQALARTPTTSAELPFAQRALQLADQEMDLAFALAVLDVTQHPPALSAAATGIKARLEQAEDALAAKQAEVKQLAAAEEKAAGSEKDAMDKRLDLAKAQLELNQDEVDDAKQDLVRAGGDPQDRIQAMVQEHKAASESSDTTKIAVAAPAEPHGLVQRFEQWWALHEKQLQLWRARQEADSAATQLAARHDSLERQSGPQGNRSSGPAAATTPQAGANAGTGSGQSLEQSAALLNATKRRAADSKALSTLDRRIDNEKQLAGVYGQWIGVVAAGQRSLLNGGLRGVLVILLIAILALFVDDWIANLLGRMTMDRRQHETLRTATGVTLQIVGVLLVLLVIFGPPTQLGTILGLAGAGLTVALKDFIIGFFGWFVLMGKNGIRLGDWVEINGVTGEVVELGVFHTVLLETGNWTDSGHPTGRRVTFTNSFAVEGHYFNFSTSGQWLWDELKVVIPAGQNPYPIVDAIHKKVLEATSQGASQAEQEWRGTIRSHDMNKLTATPSINVKPVVGGTELSVRYITRASERTQMRARLNSAAVDVLGIGPAPQADSEPEKPALRSH